MSKPTHAPRLPPRAWLDAIAEAEADFAAGKVRKVDLEALCRELEAEAAQLEANMRRPGVA